MHFRGNAAFRWRCRPRANGAEKHFRGTAPLAAFWGGNAFPRKCISAPLAAVGAEMHFRNRNVWLVIQSASACRPGAGMQQPRAGDAARDAGAAAPAAGETPSWTTAASGCAAFVGGVVRSARCAVVPHRRAGRQAACNMHVRGPASARARSLLARNCA